MELIREALGLGRPGNWKDACEKLVTVVSGREKTYYVKVQHWRRRRKNGRYGWQEHHPGRSSWTPPAKGGVTSVQVCDPKGRLLAQGFAVCSLEDVYDEQEGMRRAWERILPGMEKVKRRPVRKRETPTDS